MADLDCVADLDSMWQNCIEGMAMFDFTPVQDTSAALVGDYQVCAVFAIEDNNVLNLEARKPTLYMECATMLANFTHVEQAGNFVWVFGTELQACEKFCSIHKRISFHGPKRRTKLFRRKKDAPSLNICWDVRLVAADMRKKFPALRQARAPVLECEEVAVDAYGEDLLHVGLRLNEGQRIRKGVMSRSDAVPKFVCILVVFKRNFARSVSDCETVCGRIGEHMVEYASSTVGPRGIWNQCTPDGVTYFILVDFSKTNKTLSRALVMHHADQFVPRNARFQPPAMYEYVKPKGIEHKQWVRNGYCTMTQKMHELVRKIKANEKPMEVGVDRNGQTCLILRPVKLTPDKGPSDTGVDGNTHVDPVSGR